MSTPAPEGRWRPILTGDLADQARQAIEEIAAVFPDAEPVSPYAQDRTGEPATFAGGSAGHAILYTYLANAWQRDDFAELAEGYLDQAVEALANEPMGASLYGGFSGVAWAAEHLQGRLYESEDGEDPNEEIDQALADLLDHPWTETYDLIGGLVGFAVYALERIERPSARLCLERVVDRLNDLAERQEGGRITWFTPPEQLPEHQRVTSPNGYYNLGVAHGVPGVIEILGRACRAGVALDKARPLLDGAVTWLLEQRLPAGDGSCFGYTVSPGVEARAPSRVAWCYGDLGLAAALLSTARAVGNEDWEREALAIARLAAPRTEESAGVRDAGLCHGSIGNAHIFNRLYQATGEEIFRTAAETWYRSAFALRRPGEGIAGFLTYFGGFQGGPEWLAAKGFLEGAAGIALGLLAGISDLAPDWDRALCVSVAPQS